MKILKLLIIPVLFLGFGACQHPGKTEEHPAGVPEKTERADSPNQNEPKREPGETRINIDRMTEFIWWNQQSMIEALDLKPEQRKRMDEHLKDYLSRWSEMATKNQKAQRIAREAFKTRDFDAALKAADDLAEASAYLNGGALRLRAKVFRELSPEQMQKVIDEQPFLLRRRWIKGTRARG